MKFEGIEKNYFITQVRFERIYIKKEYVVKGLIKVIGVLCAAGIIGGCSVTVIAPEETKIKAENNLVDLSVDVDGSTTNVDAIDLADVTIGDVYFSYIQGGTSTTAKTTSRLGKVSIFIDTAIVLTTVLGKPVDLAFPNIDPMSTNITRDVTNTVVFDRSTASQIFSALAKKKVK